MIRAIYIFYICLIVSLSMTAQVGQINIPRIDKMPNAPSPYIMRDWSSVAKKYDAFVYDIYKNGQYLPLIKIQSSGINYVNAQKFSLPSYIGSPSGNEAINVLPSLVGASLVGIDKTNQNGKDYIKMSFDFFNKANGENLYLNNAGASSGDDWWYDIMPNVYFYQLYDLYPNLGSEADYQFNTIANTFTKAIKTMNGSDTPWQKAAMNFRAWKFKTMTPNTSGVPEPEASGSMAWLLYNAYNKTANKDYLKASEWAMEFLSEWPSNPSYELQLPYGVYTAARMNAELNTDYNIDKMVNWCFDKGNLRGWGAIKGTWGGLDVSGLIGEANDGGNDYAFQMNGIHQAAMLVPMTRYEKRYSKAIAKWVLNLANANRLFYHGFLPADRQDATAWSSTYDVDKVIGYEALREVWQGKSPFSTGDALKGGWAATNLALYGTSSIGYLGSIIETTNVEKVLKLDLLKTDFYKNQAYPTFLFYNPMLQNVEVQFDAGNENVDIYDVLNEKFILKNIKGINTLSIPQGEAVTIVLCPANGTIAYNQNKMLVNGVVVDYNQHIQAYSYKPRIKSLASDVNPIQKGKTCKLYCTAKDIDSPTLIYQWSAENGTVIGNNSTVDYTAPNIASSTKIQCIVKDEVGNADTALIIMEVVEKINTSPEIIKIEKGSGFISTNEVATFICNAVDADGDPLVYDWTIDGGIINGSGKEITWNSAINGVYNVSVNVTDTDGARTVASTKILVKDFENKSYKAIAYYPFTGNAFDESGNGLHGQAKGVINTNDKDGQSSSAYYFNGGAQHVLIPNDQKLNFTNGIAVCAWVKPLSLPDKETFVVSHGSWQNRWKVSITPDKNLRWTINTQKGISDLDASQILSNDMFTHVCATYDQDIMAIYINGNLSSYKKQTGLLNTTTLAMTIGQMLPDNALYNFKGTLDEVVIFDQAISPSQVENIYKTGIISHAYDYIKKQNGLLKIIPNPGSNYFTISIENEAALPLSISLINSKGEIEAVKSISITQDKIAIDMTDKTPGLYTIKVVYKTRVYFGRLMKIQ